MGSTPTLSASIKETDMFIRSLPRRFFLIVFTPLGLLLSLLPGYHGPREWFEFFENEW